jgi:hypothetical protein
MRALFVATLLLTSLAAAAQEAPQPAADAAPRFLVAPKLGLWVPTSRLGNAAFAGLQADWVTPWAGGALSLGLEVSWTRPKFAGTLSDPQLRAADTTVNLGASQLGFTLLATWRFSEMVAGLVPYAGGGPGLYAHRVASTAFAENTLEKESKLGLQLVGGAELRAGPGSAYLELDARLARVDFVTTGFTSLGGLAVAAGYRFKL